MEEIILEEYLGFEWDEGNFHKNHRKHDVLPLEYEQVFFNKPLLICEDAKHSKVETRWYALGQTDAQRKLLIVFTVRKHLIRIISARDMSKKERNVYEQA
jgi:uncharacterized DUF497 family protein